ENLICAGAFDMLEGNRAMLMENVEMLGKISSASAYEKESGQVSLFGGDAGTKEKKTLQAKTAWDDLSRLQKEFGALGFYLSSHPLDTFGPLLKRLGAVSAASLSAIAGSTGSTRAKVAGIVISKQERTAKSGNRFA